VIVIVQPRRIAAVVCFALGVASLALMWNSVIAATAIDTVALPLAVVGAVGLIPYLGAGRGGPRPFSRLLAHVAVLALAASLSLGVIWAVAAIRVETLPWWVAIPLIVVAAVLVIDERWPLRARLARPAPESSSSS